MANKITDDQYKQFLRIASGLSPENLYCDGEISHAQAMKKRKALLADWAKIEKDIGRKVSEDEVWDWSFNSRGK